MSLNVNLRKWTRASLWTHFKEEVSPTTLLLEGENRSVLKDKLTYVELRIDGPRITQPSNNVYELRVTVNVLVSCRPDGQNQYVSDDIVDRLLQAFIANIPFTDMETPSNLGCFKLEGDRPVDVSDWGNIGSDVKLRQLTVEGNLFCQICL